MRTKTIEIYEISELTGKAKQTAIEAVRRKEESYGYSYADEAIKSLQKFAEHFNCELGKYEIDFFNSSYSFAKFKVPESMQELTKKELKRIILSMGSYDKKTLRGNGDCKFTGIDKDEDAADGARIAFFNGQTNVEELLNEGFKTWLKACQEDAEYQFSDEGITELIECNDFEFSKEGKII